MKKLFCGILLISSIVFLASWGYIGHQAVGIIAENHLTPEAKTAVQTLLGGKELGDIASWADEIRDDKTFPEHFINAPLGLSRRDFEAEVKNQAQDNVYKAILANEEIIKNPAASKADKEKALKFIVHFVGDLHQPMHVSRKEDKGGNTIQLQFEDKGTNLHSMWDSKLIDKQGLKTSEIANQFDHATPEEIRQWQSDNLMDWLWESYQISTKLYQESLPGSKLGDDYYQSHIKLVDERIEKAGIRLAGLLNGLLASPLSFGNYPENPAPVVRELLGSVAYTPVKLDKVAGHIGENVNVIGTVADFKDLGNLLLINLGKPYPNSQLTLLFKGEAKTIGEKINPPGLKLLVIGKLIDYKGKPEIEITKAEQLLNPPQ